MSEQWVVVEGPTGCRDRNNPDPAQRCECHGFGIETTDEVPHVICWADDGGGITPGIHRRRDAEAIVEAHNAMPALLDELERLRAVIKEAETRGPERDCPWCDASRAFGDQHHADCAAFARDGEVK